MDLPGSSPSRCRSWSSPSSCLDGRPRCTPSAATCGRPSTPRATGRPARLADGGRSGFLVAGEFALAAILLVCGTLLVKAFDRVRHVDPGFRSDRVLTAMIPLSEGTRPKPEQWPPFWHDFELRARAIPGVDGAGLIACAPAWAMPHRAPSSPEGAVPRPDGKNRSSLWRTATPGYCAGGGASPARGRFVCEDAGQPTQPAPDSRRERDVRPHVLGRGGQRRGTPRQAADEGRPGHRRRRGRRRQALRARAPVRPGIYFPQSRWTRRALTIGCAAHAGQIRAVGHAGALREVLRHDGRRNPALSRPDDGGCDPAVDGAARRVLLDARRVRVARVRAGDRRGLRRGDVSRDAAHARDRYPRRARRGDARHHAQRRRERREVTGWGWRAASPHRSRSRGCWAMSLRHSTRGDPGPAGFFPRANHEVRPNLSFRGARRSKCFHASPQSDLDRICYHRSARLALEKTDRAEPGKSFRDGMGAVAWGRGDVDRGRDFQDPRVEHLEEMSLPQAAWIGAVQILSAVFPGTSRSMCTIAAGQIAGLSRSAALEFSFFLSMPTMVVATGYDLLKTLGPQRHAETAINLAPATINSQGWIVLAIGFSVSFIVALAVVAWFMRWVRARGFAPFAIYRIVLGLLLLVFIARGVV